MDEKELGIFNEDDRIYFVSSNSKNRKSGVAFCSMLCIAKAELYSEDITNHIRTIEVKPDNPACIHCFDCGGIIFTPLIAGCSLHGNTCPDNIWNLRGFQVIGFLKTWKTLTHRDADDEVLDLANDIGSDDSDINFVELVKIIKSQLNR